MTLIVVGVTLALAVIAVGVALIVTITGRFSEAVRPWAKSVAVAALVSAILPAAIGLTTAFVIVAGAPSESEIASYPTQAQEEARVELDAARAAATPVAKMGLFGSGSLVAPALLMVVVAPRRKGWEEELEEV